MEPNCINITDLTNAILEYLVGGLLLPELAHYFGERMQSWSRLSEQNLRADKWRVCRG
jgi:hypothetical protein